MRSFLVASGIIFLLSMTLLTSCQISPDIAPGPAKTGVGLLTESKRLQLVESQIKKNGRTVSLAPSDKKGARSASLAVQGNWSMIGWMQFPSARFPGCLDEFDYPQWGFTDQYSSIRRYVEPNFYQNLSLSELQSDGQELPYGTFTASTNVHYLNFNNFSGSPYWVNSNTIVSGIDIQVIYLDGNFMCLASTNRAGDTWHYTMWLRQ